SFTFFGWWFLPERITTLGLPYIHDLLRSRGYNPPPQGSRLYVNQWRQLYATVNFGYLFYSLCAGVMGTKPNFYELLRVSKHANENDLKIAFRNFAKRNHPDRVGPQGT